MTLPSSSALDHCQKCVAMFKIWTLMLIKIAVEIEWMDWCNSILVWCGYGPCTKPESAKRGMEGLASTAGAATAESIVQQGNVVRQSIKPRFEQGVVVMLTLAVWNVNTWPHGNARQAGNIAKISSSRISFWSNSWTKASFGGKKTDWRDSETGSSLPRCWYWHRANVVNWGTKK